MSKYNIVIGGVGGQGLILTTNIICQAALKSGYEVKSNDVVGLAQRGGMVWGSVKIGKKVHSPNIPPGEGNILIGMELLEAYRWKTSMKDGSLVILNDYKIPPVPVISEQEEYPPNIIEELSQNHKVISLNAIKESKKIGTDKVANIMILGILAKNMDIDKEIWLDTIKENVPEKFIKENEEAFEYGYKYQ
ncbi:MAG: indolepyruvate oxidoreductase subunit beta [Bacillota bacterium]|nr:indolepyruvate oxidoreductase subunit beta [Bacillota bacterium]